MEGFQADQTAKFSKDSQDSGYNGAGLSLGRVKQNDPKMSDQYSQYSFPVLEDRYLLENYMIYPTGFQNNGGYQLDRQSNASSMSYSSNNCLSLPPSPLESKLDYDNNSLTLQQYDSSLTTTYLAQPESIKHTPSSLGWGRGTDLVKLYTFIVHKGKEPYFQLRDEWTPTPQTPSRVYLDQTKGYKKNEYPCVYPGICYGKQNVFGRQADLDRHYKVFHADERESFFCDYPKCVRSREPFTRKDHYRDHLRDFHKEDIGHAKAVKDKKNDKRTWGQTQQDWLASRKISEKHWRCVKCLVRNYVAQSGWDCSRCKTSCDKDRRRAREELAPRESSEFTGESEGYAAAVPSLNCNTYSGNAWNEVGHGDWSIYPAYEFSGATFDAYGTWDVAAWIKDIPTRVGREIIVSHQEVSDIPNAHKLTEPLSKPNTNQYEPKTTQEDVRTESARAAVQGLDITADQSKDGTSKVKTTQEDVRTESTRAAVQGLDITADQSKDGTSKVKTTQEDVRTESARAAVQGLDITADQSKDGTSKVKTTQEDVRTESTRAAVQRLDITADQSKEGTSKVKIPQQEFSQSIQLNQEPESIHSTHLKSQNMLKRLVPRMFFHSISRR